MFSMSAVIYFIHAWYNLSYIFIFIETCHPCVFFLIYTRVQHAYHIVLHIDKRSPHPVSVSDIHRLMFAFDYPSFILHFYLFAWTVLWIMDMWIVRYLSQINSFASKNLETIIIYYILCQMWIWIYEVTKFWMKWLFFK